MQGKRTGHETRKAQDYPQRLLRLRTKLEMTQRQLAKDWGVSPGAIAHWESGTNPIPGPVRCLIELYEEHKTKPR